MLGQRCRPDPAGVIRYSTANPPVYQKANEAALSSPAVINDVVFVSTTNPADSEMSLYALDAATGLCLWAAPKVLNGGWPNYSLGPAISGEYVAAGAGEALYILHPIHYPVVFVLEIPTLVGMAFGTSFPVAANWWMKLFQRSPLLVTLASIVVPGVTHGNHGRHAFAHRFCGWLR